MKRRGQLSTRPGTRDAVARPNPDFMSSVPGSSHGKGDSEGSDWSQFGKYSTPTPPPPCPLPPSGSGQVTVKTDIVVEVDDERGPSSFDNASDRTVHGAMAIGERGRVERYAGAYAWRGTNDDTHDFV
jgi:hypothetical protein